MRQKSAPLGCSGDNLGINRMTRKILKSGLLFICVQIFSAPTFAEEFIGHVVSIADGDTLTVLVNEHDRIKVRLSEIDAPEKAQPFGQRSKQSLSDICFDKDAVLQKTGTDRYGRMVAKVYCAGVDANAEQIRTGMAWAYRKYLRDQSLLNLDTHFAIRSATKSWQNALAFE